MAWKGDIKNPVPNPVKESIDLSEKFVADNRAEQVRRDKDEQKNFTITFEDIDGAILQQLQQLQLQVLDSGKKVNVPIFFGSPERWVSAQRDGYIRDKQGKLILPAMILKRSNSEQDQNLIFFNRYLETPAMKVYSEKNKYTQFSALTGQNAPVNEVFNVIVPKHMVMTYHCIVWTAYVEQMNEVMQPIIFATQDYWGSSKGFRFRVMAEGGYTHNIEIQAGDERLVRTEFELKAHGYILPDSTTYLERHKMTTQKRMTPKKIVIGTEIVRSDFELESGNSNADKWRNPQYPNLQYNTVIPSAGVALDSTMTDGTLLPSGAWRGIKVDNSPLFLRIVPVPTAQAAGGQDGDISYDSQFLYFRTNHQWKRVALAESQPSCSENIPLYGKDGSIEYNAQFFYIYSKGSWRKTVVSTVNLSTPASEGDIMYDESYIYIYTKGEWRRIAVADFQK